MSTRQRIRTIVARRAGNGGRRQRGAVIVEFALVAALYLVLILAIVEFGILFWVNLTMQYAVREGARCAIVGCPGGGSRYENIIATMKDSSMGQWDAVGPPTISITLNPGPGVPAQDYANPDQYAPGMFGNAGDVVVFRLNCRWPLVTPLSGLLKVLKPDGAFIPGGVYPFSVAATMRNEAFPP
jgi:Flp pilus assembly protein TadG